jgi:hypothetical protein
MNLSNELWPSGLLGVRWPSAVSAAQPQSKTGLVMPDDGSPGIG